jgi:Ser/Thr protein kinase RdoA (MazF antagonist)
MADRLLSNLDRGNASRVPSHGDFHPENVFVGPGIITVIDFDRAGVREPAFDVGYALGQLLAMSYLSLGDWQPGARAGLEFWGHYERERPAPPPWSRVAVHAARGMLLSLYWEVCALPGRRTDLVSLWLDLIETWLRSREPATLETLGEGRPA